MAAVGDQQLGSAVVSEDCHGGTCGAPLNPEDLHAHCLRMRLAFDAELDGDVGALLVTIDAFHPVTVFEHADGAVDCDVAEQNRHYASKSFSQNG